MKPKRNSYEDGNDHKGSPRYQIRLLIKHPNIDPAFITKTTGIVPDSSWKSGEKRVTPAGRELKGVQKHSMWCYSFTVTGNRVFSEDIKNTIDMIESESKLMSEITSGGGVVQIIVNLPGDANVCGEISSVDLSRLSKLNINIGFEVFPSFS